jgi:DnaJ-class molecular chaperone
VKKAQQEIMRRYHPDKHSQHSNNEAFMNEINEICRITNKIFEAISEHRK